MFQNLTAAHTTIGMLGVLFSIVLLVTTFIERKAVHFPKGSIYLLLFCLVQIPFIYLFKSNYSIVFLLLFTSGTLFLILAFNQNSNFRDSFVNILINMSLILGAVYIICRFAYDPLHLMNSPLFYSANENLHIHIGDLFAVVFVLSLYKFLNERKKYNAVVAAVSIFFVALSFSRSALLSLAAGVLYMLSIKNYFTKYKKMSIILFIALAVVFLFEGVSKSIFLDRVYYLSTISVFTRFPLGIGLGNFSKIPMAENLGFASSLYTHSLPLEVLIGTGIWSLPFFIWLYVIIKDIFGKPREENIEYKLMFLVLAISLSLDTTYAISSMFWIAFISIGLAQSHPSSGGNS